MSMTFVWQWGGGGGDGWMYGIVSWVTSDIGVPSTHLAVCQFPITSWIVILTCFGFSFSNQRGGIQNLGDRPATFSRRNKSCHIPTTSRKVSTVWYHYNAVNFHPNNHNRPISRYYSHLVAVGGHHSISHIHAGTLGFTYLEIHTVKYILFESSD